MSTTLTFVDPVERADAAAFVGRLSRWDPMSPVRIRREDRLVRLWAGTPFDTLVTRAVRADCSVADVTVHAANLVSALAVSTAQDVDPGPAIDAQWRAQLPPPGGWISVDSVPASVLSEVADAGVRQAKENAGPLGGAPAGVLDAEAILVTGNGMKVSVPMRVLLALSGMGFAPADASGEPEQVRVRATDSWLRLDARFGTVMRRRHALLPLFV